MTPRTCRQLIALGSALIVWSTLTLTAVHGGRLLEVVTR